MTKDVLKIKVDNSRLRFQIVNILPAGLASFSEPSTSALLYKKGDLGFYVCHVSGFSPKRYKNV